MVLVLTYSWLERPLGGSGHSLSHPKKRVQCTCPPSRLCLFQNDCKPPEEPQRPPTLQEIKQKIESYNAREKNCLGMKLVSVRARAPSLPPPSSQPLLLWLRSSPSESWGSPSQEGAPLSLGLWRPPGLREAKNLGCPCSGETDWAMG